MVAIVDAGSTKSSWFFGNPNQPENGMELELPGLNPVQDSEGRMERMLRDGLLIGIDNKTVKALYYYGAGCSDPLRARKIQLVLLRLFPAAKIEVRDDLEGAARALCGHQPGVACILGTGSNAGFWNGKELDSRVINLGPILGDEGSGMHLGKALLTAVLYNDLPPFLEESFFEDYPFTRENLLQELYNQKKPHVWMASFTPFLAKYQDHTCIHQLICTVFNSFINRHLLALVTDQHTPIHFVGSIAYHFAAILEGCLQKAGLRVGKIIRRPADALVRWHSESDPSSYQE